MINIRVPKIIVWVTVAGLVLMAGLVVTGLTLMTRSATVRAAEPEPVGVEAMMSLSPTYGGANTFVNITGIGYPENTRVRLFLTSPTMGSLGERPHAEALTDDMGRFSVMLQMPSVWPDGTTITDEELVVMAVTEDGSMHASAVFDFIPPAVQPEISVTPTIGGGGTPVTVTSVGFPVGSRVLLRLGPPEGGYGPQVYGEGVADASGAVNITFAMPDNWPDGSRVKEEQLEIVAETDDGSVRASSGFDYVPIPHPLMAVAPNYGGPGTTVTITGDGYPAGVRVLIKLGTSVDDAAQRPAYVETMADTRGNINLPWVMPAAWPNGLPILTRDVVVLATAADRSGYGWMGFAYLEFAPLEAVTQETVEEDEEEQTEGEEDIESQEQPADAVLPDILPEEVEGPVIVDPTGGIIVVEPGAGVEVPSDTQVEALPAIVLTPEEAGAETLIEVSGTGFPPGVGIYVRLGVTAEDPDPEIVAETVTGADGSFTLSFPLPATWPDGTAIEEGDLHVVVSTADSSSVASAVLRFLLAGSAQ